MLAHLDLIDRKILRVLQDNSRLSAQELGERVGLSASACHRRIKALEDRGLVLGYRAVLDARALGYRMQFFLEVSLSSQSVDALIAFEAAVGTIPEILECHLMAGQADYLLRVLCEDGEAFEALHRRLVTKLPGLARMHSNMSIREVKSPAALPL